MKVDGIEIVIESDAKKAIAELDRLIAKLGQTSTAMQSVKGMKNASTGIKGTANSLKSYTGTANKATKSTFSLASAFGRFYASCFLVIRGVKAIGRAIGSSMDYIETYNYFNVITDKIGTEFGSAWKENGYNSAEDYANSFRDRLTDLTTKMTGYKIGAEGGLIETSSIGLGLDPEAITNFEASIASITNAVGLIGEASVNTSTALTMLSADMSSLKNVDLETVMTNFQSGLIGQSRALYKYGIDITNTKLAEYALAEGISKKVSEMTQAEKMQLRMIAILDQSKISYGDMANTINSVANQYRVFKQQVSNLARTFGNLFVPILQSVLPIINGITIALTRMFSWIGTIIYGSEKWKKIMDGTSKGYTDTGLEAIGEDADDTTDSLENANKAAKKLKKTIFGYDQLNIAQDNTEDTGTGTSVGGGGIDLSGKIADSLLNYQSVWDKALEDMENKVEEIADKIQSAFSRMWKAIEPVRKSIKALWNNGLAKLQKFNGKALEDFYNEFLKPIGKWVVGKGLPDLINHLNKVLSKFNWDSLNTKLRNFWKNVEPFAEKIGTGLIEFLKDMISFSASTLSAVGTALENIGKALGFVTKHSPATIEGIGYAIGVFITAVWGFKKVVGITEGITSLAGSIAKMIVAHPYIAIAAGIAAVCAAVYGFEQAVKNQEEIERYGDTVENLSNSIFSFSQSVKDHAEEAEKYVNGAGLAEIALAEDLSDKYETLSQKANLTAGEKQKLVDYSSQLVELIPGLNGYLDEETGILEIQKDTLDGLIKKSKEYYTVKAAESKLLETYGNKIDAEANVKQAETALETAKQSYENAKDYLSYWDSLDIANRLFQDPLGTEYNDAKEAVADLELEIIALSSNLGLAEQSLAETNNTISALNDVVDGTTQTMDIASTKAYTYGTNVVKGYNKGIKDTKIETDKECTSWMDDFCAGATKALGIHSPSTVFKGYGENTVKGFNEGIRGLMGSSESVISEWAQKVSGWFTSKFKIHSPSKLFEVFGNYTVEGFNNGIENMVGSSIKTIDGWSNAIKMEMQPEITSADIPSQNMGSVNYKNIANQSNDQITDGIRGAVIDGMMEVFMATNTQSSGNGNTETHIHVQFGDTELGVATYKGLKSAGRKGLIPSIV